MPSTVTRARSIRRRGAAMRVWCGCCLDSGADVSWRDAAGKTALDVATEKGHAEVVAMLEARRRKRSHVE